MANWQGKMETATDLIFLGSKITEDANSNHEVKRRSLLGRKAMTNLDSILKSRDITLQTKVHCCGFSSSHEWMLELDHKEHWAPNWCFWMVVLEKTLDSPLDCKEIKPVHLTGNQPWIFIAKTEAEATKLLPPDVKSQLTGKDPDPGKDWRLKEKRVAEDEIVGWHHRFNGHEFEQTQGDSEGQGSLACCRPCGHRESDRTEWLNNNDKSTKGCKIKMKILCLSLWRKTETRTKETDRYFWKY